MVLLVEADLVERLVEVEGMCAGVNVSCAQRVEGLSVKRSPCLGGRLGEFPMAPGGGGPG